MSVARNFFELDVVSCLLAAALFSLFAFVPGYVAAWLTGLLDFRHRGWLARFTISVPLSLGVTPAAAYLAGRFLGMPAAWLLFGLIAAAFVAILGRDWLLGRKPEWRLSKRTWIYAAIAAAWAVFGLLSLVDVQFRDRLYFSVVSFDYSLRSAIVSSISRTGIPPANPYFFPGHGEMLRYHYFWLIPCSLVNVLGSPFVSARQAIIGGTLWTGAGLLAIIPLFLRFVHPSGARRIHRRSLIGIGLLTVTGLDVLPNLLRDIANMPLPDPEWWNSFQVSSWATSLLWVPHHTAAMIAGLMAICIVWTSAETASLARRAAWAVLAALSVASCLGSSIYVGLIFGCAIGLWTLFLLAKGSRGQALFAAAAGILAVALVSRHLLDLRGGLAGATGGGSGPILAFRISDFVFSGFFRGWIQHSVFRANLVNALLLPFNYFLELGAFLIGGIWTLKRWRAQGRRLSGYQAATLIFAGVSIVICTTLRSSVIANNDLGCRGFLLAQFVLLLWMTDLLDRKAALPSRQRFYLGFLLALGVLGTVNEAAVLRTFPIAYDLLNIPRQDWLPEDHNLGRRTFALRAGYESLRAALPQGAIVQHNPNAIPGDLPFGLYADRQAAAETEACGVVFGGDASACAPVIGRLKPIFAGVSSREQTVHACSDLDISAILVKDTDPVWADRNSWVWHTQPIVSNSFMRALPCADKTTIPARLAVAGQTGIRK